MENDFHRGDGYTVEQPMLRISGGDRDEVQHSFVVFTVSKKKSLTGDGWPGDFVAAKITALQTLYPGLAVALPFCVTQ